MRLRILVRGLILAALRRGPDRPAIAVLAFAAWVPPIRIVSATWILAFFLVVRSIAMNRGTSVNPQPRTRMIAAALAHLAEHMQNGCVRSAHLAALSLERIARGVEADRYLREHARELAETLDPRGERTEGAWGRPRGPIPPGRASV